MIGIVVVAHAPLASAFAACAQHVLGVQVALYPYDCPPDQSPALSTEAIIQLMARADTAHQGVLVLTDLSGATPFNVAMQAAQACAPQRVVLLSGLNMPMLLRALSYQHLPLDEVALKAREGAVSGLSLNKLPAEAEALTDALPLLVTQTASPELPGRP